MDRNDPQPWRSDSSEAWIFANITVINRILAQHTRTVQREDSVPHEDVPIELECTWNARRRRRSVFIRRARVHFRFITTGTLLLSMSNFYPVGDQWLTGVAGHAIGLYQPRDAKNNTVCANRYRELVRDTLGDTETEKTSMRIEKMIGRVRNISKPSVGT
jgi:hypothetical protein